MRPLRTALLVLLTALSPGAAIRPAGAGIFVREGKVAFEIRQNGSPLRDFDVEVAIRSRNEEPPRVVFEARNPRLVALPDGDYDCLLTHHHLFTEPVRYHRFRIEGGKTVVIPSDVRTQELLVRPYVGETPADDRAVEVEYMNTTSSVAVRTKGVSPVVLPEAQYRVRLRARDANGAVVTREKTFYLACSQELRLDL